MSAIERAVIIIGGQTTLANILSVKQQQVWCWVNRHKQAPAKYILDISNATAGVVSVDELLADHQKKIRSA